MAETKSFKVPNPIKRSPNNKSVYRKENEVIKGLQNEGIITDLILGAKYCLPTSKLNYDQIDQVKTLFDNGLCRSFSVSDTGWLAASIKIDNAEKVKPALEKYREFAAEDKDLFISGYGEVELTIDFSKVGMLMDPDSGNVYYPYGAFFFSDNKTIVNQFNGTVACLPARYQKLKNKKNLSPISSDNWTEAKISGSFTRRGHFVIFYVTEDVEKEPGVWNPIVNIVDIEVVASKNYKNSEVEGVFIGKVEKYTSSVADEVEFLIRKVYNKYAIPSAASQYFMSDYIFSIGYNPKAYDLTIAVDNTQESSVKFKSNFAGNKAHRADTNKSESGESTHGKPQKGKKAKGAAKAKAATTEVKQESDTAKAEEVAPVAEAVPEVTESPAEVTEVGSSESKKEASED